MKIVDRVCNLDARWRLARPLRAGLLLATLAAGTACNDQSVTVQLRSLQASGDVSYVCRAVLADGALEPTDEASRNRGVPLAECNPGTIAPNEQDLIALVTQTSTGEVALINVPLDPDAQRGDEGVIDVDPTTPNFTFLRIGERPGDIISTPGGKATFVAVGEVGKPGIFGLPTSCLGPPGPGETRRDLTSWPACSLPTTPGAMAVLVDRELTADGKPFQGCDRSLGEQQEEPEAASDRRECPVNLGTEGGERGRRKLVVALPDYGSVAVIDAQWLLDREPGSFEACRFEAEYPLRVELPATRPAQEIPEDLGSLAVGSLPTPPPPPAFTARPSDFALADNRLFVSDETAPVVHVLDVTDACGVVEAPPLLPTSFDAPNRLVTTSRIAASPLTPSGKRYLYAVDELDGEGPSLMAFDIGGQASQRTPIVRPGSPYLPFEAPDRIQLGGAVKDLTFVLRDQPAFDPETGAARVGEACDPTPGSTSLGTTYRPNAEFTVGARATKLRGVFAVAMLTTGQLSVVDVEDFDAACRRPVSGNPTPEEDFRGCRNDALPLYQEADGRSTVTGEVSCRAVQPHHARASTLAITRSSIGVRAPSLASFPQLVVPDTAAGSSLEERPKLLGVDFAGDGAPASAARVFVGTVEYARALAEPPGEAELTIDPARAQQHSLVLPFNEPRAYPQTDDVRLEYEGPLTETRPGGLFRAGSEGSITLDDPGTAFCDRGVHDPSLIGQLAEERFGLTGPALSSFAAEHADHVVVTADFPAPDDRYWSVNRQQCSYSECEELFGAFDDEQLSVNREFSIVDAQQQRLTLTARGELTPEQRARWSPAEAVNCCFPSGTAYAIHATRQWVLRGSSSGLRHDVIARSVTTESGESVLDCVRGENPRRRYFESRVFEIAADGPCAHEDMSRAVRVDEAAARCVHHVPTARFAVYRGARPSIRGMAFTWRTLGGFSPLTINLAAITSVVSPQAIVGLPEMDWLTVVDAASLGLALVDLDELSVLTPTLN